MPQFPSKLKHRKRIPHKKGCISRPI